MNKGTRSHTLKLSLPQPDESIFAKFLTKSGTFTVGDLLVNKDGVRILPQNEEDTAPPPIKPSDDGLSLDDMDTIKVIGNGSGGTVQLVQHKWTRQFFALKDIRMSVEESTCKQIAREMKINQSAQCPYVVVCYQCFYFNGSISIILEYMDGGSLLDLLRKVNTIPEHYLASISNQVLKGLVYLHRKKHIIHRDLKPSNLLINHRGEVKITDFGVSAVLQSTSAQANTFVGTRTYMSPERIIGGKHSYKCDLWSLGLLLFECATGRFPYLPAEPGGEWGSFYDLMVTIQQQPSPSLPPEHFSPEFCSFISSCLHKEPSQRLSATQLLGHPFLSMHEEADLAAYFSSV